MEHRVKIVKVVFLIFLFHVSLSYMSVAQADSFSCLVVSDNIECRTEGVTVLSGEANGNDEDNEGVEEEQSFIERLFSWFDIVMWIIMGAITFVILVTIIIIVVIIVLRRKRRKKGIDVEFIEGDET